MKPLVTFAGLMGLLWTLAAVTPAMSQDAKKDDKPAAKKEAPAKKEAKEAAPAKKAAAATASAGETKPRLPFHYASLGLSAEQDTKVRAIQQKYKAQLDDLRAKLEALREKQDAELQGVLNDEQKTKLAEAKAKVPSKKGTAAKTAAKGKTTRSAAKPATAATTTKPAEKSAAESEKEKAKKKAEKKDKK